MMPTSQHQPTPSPPLRESTCAVCLKPHRSLYRNEHQQRVCLDCLLTVTVG